MLKAVAIGTNGTPVRTSPSASIARFREDASTLAADGGRSSGGGPGAPPGPTRAAPTANGGAGRETGPNLGFSKEGAGGGGGSASPIPSSTRRLPTMTAKFFPSTRTTMSLTPTPCRAHTPRRFSPGRTGRRAALRALYQPQLSPGRHRVPHGLGGDLADAPFEARAHAHGKHHPLQARCHLLSRAVERMNRTLAQEWQYARAWEAARRAGLPPCPPSSNTIIWERPHSACGAWPPMSRIVGVNNLSAHKEHLRRLVTQFGFCRS